MKPDSLTKWQSLDIAEHTREQIARDLMEPDPERDEFCETAAYIEMYGSLWPRCEAHPATGNSRAR